MGKSIGVFDSGYGGLSVLKKLREYLPAYDFVYLGDNARSPYGNRSFDLVYKFSLEVVKELFSRDCDLIIFACNTASAKALRTIQTKDLPNLGIEKRVLGVIRPSVEALLSYTKSHHVGLFATTGTVKSMSYPLEIQKLHPHLILTQEDCPMWVPLVENNEHLSPGADYFIEKHIDHLLSKDDKIDSILLACTHYPLLESKIREYLPKRIKLISQGQIVAESLRTYLNKHPEMDSRLGKNAKCDFYTSESVSDFEENASFFLDEQIKAQHISF